MLMKSSAEKKAKPVLNKGKGVNEIGKRKQK